MKISTTKAQGPCDACGRTMKDLYIVVFEEGEAPKLLCEFCLDWTRKLLEIVNVKEAEA